MASMVYDEKPDVALKGRHSQSNENLTNREVVRGVYFTYAIRDTSDTVSESCSTKNVRPCMQ